MERTEQLRSQMRDEMVQAAGEVCLISGQLEDYSAIDDLESINVCNTAFFLPIRRRIEQNLCRW
jgi:hypothetical protein